MQEKVFFKNSYGLNICAIMKAPNPGNKHIILMFHGLPSSKNSDSLNALSDILNQNNLNTMLVDFNGNGESEGSFAEQTITSHIEDAKAAIEFAKEKGFETIDLYGASAFGPVAIALSTNGPNINRIGLKAPVSDYIERFENKPIDENFRGVDDWKEKGYTYYANAKGEKFRLNYTFYEDAKNHIAYEKAKDIKCPVLILHGDQDTTVDYRQSQKLAQLSQKVSLIIVEGGNHKLEVEGDSSYANEMFADWFKRGKAQ